MQLFSEKSGVPESTLEVNFEVQKEAKNTYVKSTGFSEVISSRIVELQSQVLDISSQSQVLHFNKPDYAKGWIAKDPCRKPSSFCQIYGEQVQTQRSED